MADYHGDLLPTDGALIPFDAGFIYEPLPNLHKQVILDRTAPCAVRVLGKSIHVVALGWAVTVGWLWLAQVVASPARGLVPAIVMVAIGWMYARAVGHAPYAALERREWKHAFAWALVPNAMLWLTTWVIVRDLVRT